MLFSIVLQTQIILLRLGRQRLHIFSYLLPFLALLTNWAFSSMPAAVAHESVKFVQEVRLENENCTGFLLKIDGRNLIIEPGSCVIDGKTIKVSETSFLTIKPCPLLNIKDEQFILSDRNDEHPIYKRMPEGTLAGVGTGPVPDRVVPGSLKIFTDENGKPGHICRLGVDYAVDQKWCAIERLPASSVGANSKVLLQYSLYLRRIDSIVLNKDGSLALINGKPSQFAPSPPPLPANKLLLANVLAEPLDSKIPTSSIMPVYRMEHYYSPEFLELNEEALQHTKAKLEKGLPVKIVFCGDSVTKGSYSSTAQTSFPLVFLQKLKEKYQAATVQYLNFSQAGASSNVMFPRFFEKVLPQHPDLVVLEFVNDIALDRQTVIENYKSFFVRARAAGSEVIVCLPHLPVPSYYHVKGWSAVAGKPYFAVLKKLAPDYKIALANIASRWENAASEGVDPMLLLADELNHPNDRGHEIYAEELMRCFQ